MSRKILYVGAAQGQTGIGEAGSFCHRFRVEHAKGQGSEFFANPFLSQRSKQDPVVGLFDLDQPVPEILGHSRDFLSVLYRISNARSIG